MLNGEKYRDEILEVDESIGHTISKKYLGFSSGDYVCKTYKEINKAVLDWLFSEYKEPIKLSRLEYEVLKWLKDKNYRYITRDSEDVDIGIEEPVAYAYTEEPIKDMMLKSWKRGGASQSLYMFRELFQFIKWEDEKPTSIDNVLNNCEIVEDKEHE